jgi:hypothetical protein
MKPAFGAVNRIENREEGRPRCDPQRSLGRKKGRMTVMGHPPLGTDVFQLAVIV